LTLHAATPPVLPLHATIGGRLPEWQTSKCIWNAGLKCAACGSLQIQDAKKSPKIAIWAPSHNFFATKARIDNRKKTS